MFEIILTNIYIFILAVVLAILEIQIEGPNGWAKNLPTWRPAADKWYIRMYVKFMSGREATGYHITMFSFVFLIFNLPYFFGLDINWNNWLRTASFFLIFVVLWDFLWFVLNPHYPLKKFKKEHIWWHKKWLAFAPVDYYGSILLSGIILLPLVSMNGDWSAINWWLFNLLLFILETMVLVAFTFWVLDIDSWAKK